MDLNAISKALKLHREQLDAMHVQSLAVFGSCVRGTASSESDIDLLVTFSEPVGLFAFVRLKSYLEKILERDVDLVTPDALRDSMKTEILESAVDVTP